MSRPLKPLDPERLAQVVLKLIDRHRDKACPTRRDFIDWTGLPKQRVWPYLRELEARGLLEIETRNEYRGAGAAYRMRVVTGAGWTDWTQRRAPKATMVAMAAMAMTL